MKLSLSLSLGLWAALSSAHKLTVKKVQSSQPLARRSVYNSPSGLQLSVDAEDEKNSFDINTVHDLIYIANVTIAGVDYPVQLDTGSSDLFVKGATFPLPNTNTTPLFYNLTYAIGWAAGNVTYAPVEFVDIKIPNQAFIQTTAVKNPALSYGALGIIGLGFNRLSSIDLLVNKTNAASGRSLLFNLFEANPAEPNFLAFSLQRGSQPDDDVEGSFSIGELEPQYAHITGNAPISTWPVRNPYRWNLLLDAVIVNNSITVPTTKVVGAPSNKAVVLMDSGSSYTYAPKDICEAIYSGIPGAIYDTSGGYWKVPCGAEVNVALQIGGQVFPVHPLDVVTTTALDSTNCIGSFVPQSFNVGNDFDWLVGDNFLRSVYSVYDFGDFDSNNVMGDPYMKLLSIVDADEASVEFHKLRGGTPRTNITFTGLDGISVAPSFSISNDISASLEMIGKYIPAMLGLVALNAVILIVCCVVWLVSKCRKRNGSSRSPRNTRGRSSPMPNIPSPRNSYMAGTGSTHNYEPVSMAAVDDSGYPQSTRSHMSRIDPTSRDSLLNRSNVASPAVPSHAYEPTSADRNSFVRSQTPRSSHMPPPGSPMSPEHPQGPVSAERTSFARTPRSRMSRSSHIPTTNVSRESLVPMGPLGSPNTLRGDTYEPVSMALTEDTFVPPSPAFIRTDSKLSKEDRPNSVA